MARNIVKELPSIEEVQAAYSGVFKKSCSKDEAQEHLDEFKRQREDCECYGLWPCEEMNIGANIDNIDSFFWCIKSQRDMEDYQRAMNSLTDPRDKALQRLGSLFEPHERQVFSLYMDNPDAKSVYKEVILRNVEELAIEERIERVCENLVANFPKEYDAKFIDSYIKERCGEVASLFVGIFGDGERGMRTIMAISRSFRKYCRSRSKMKISGLKDD